MAGPRPAAGGTVLAMIRVRFAPSPTGNLHLGTVRTALFNWLFARRENGKVVLRIEDTDLKRSESEYEQNILDGLAWLGLTVDEGPLEGGPYGPYRQSERIVDGIYKAYALRLIELGHAYYAFDTDEELDVEREASKAAGIAYKYSRRAMNLTPQELQAKLESGIPYAIRFKVPDKGIYAYTDLIKGPIEIECGLISDFVILKSDGSPAYNFAVVVDDLEMKITHVIRGEDHISNTPKQGLIFKALGQTPPEYGHLPMILSPDRTKLSKRHGATAVTDYRDKGYLPEAMLNYLALLGWSSADGQELMTKEELTQKFSLDRIVKSNAVFDTQKLLWINGQYIRKYSHAALWKAAQPYLTPENKAALEQFPVSVREEMTGSIQDNLDTLADINTYIAVYTDSDATYQEKMKLQEWKDTDRQVLSAFLSRLSAIDWSAAGVSQLLQSLCEELQLGKGKVLKPVRLAVTGNPSGPDLAQVVYLLGQETIALRLKECAAA